MANIRRDAGGNWIYQYFDCLRERQTLRIGDTTKREAERVKYHVDAMVEAELSGEERGEDTEAWLATVPFRLQQQLFRLGFIDEPPARPPRPAARSDRQPTTIGQLVEAYIASRTDVEPRTTLTYRQAKSVLVERFGEQRTIATITPGDAAEFRIWLTSGRDPAFAKNTANKRCAIAKQIFAYAVDKCLIAANPFAKLKGLTVRSGDTKEFIDRELSQRIIDECPSAQWRLLFALARYGGLRCPSEVLALAWSDVHWERGRLRVPSPKTKRYDGKGERWIPLFPELRMYLEEVHELLTPGDTEPRIITIAATGNSQFRTQLHRIIVKAGEKPWPKLWNALRASRATELNNAFPAHVCAEWMGHSELVAREHYLQVTEEHYEQALQKGAANALHDSEQRAEASNQQAPMQAKSQGSKSQPRFPMPEIALEGLEHSGHALERRVASALGSLDFRDERCSGAALAELIEAWPAIDAETRSQILELATSKAATLEN